MVSSGLDLQDRLAKLGHMLPIVFLTGHGDIPASVRAIKAGAEDFLSKPVSKKPLLDAVERALARHESAREHHERLAALRALVATLTPRESEVFALVVRGKLNKQIAYELGTSERTIKAHRHNIMQKLRVRSLAELVLIAERLGIVAAPAERQKLVDQVNQARHRRSLVRRMRGGTAPKDNIRSPAYRASL